MILYEGTKLMMEFKLSAMVEKVIEIESKSIKKKKIICE